jgi:CTP synthase (UTP-ammonia lyase)
MSQKVKIGIIGDFDSNCSSHLATIEAIHHAAGRLSLESDITWVPTASLLTAEGRNKLKRFDCFWASPGSPYKSMQGAIKGIRIARESGKPFIGT